MPNPLFNALGGASSLGQLGSFGAIVQQFRQFKSQFTGDPQQKVQELLNSGRMTQAQYNELQGIAKQFMSLL